MHMLTKDLAQRGVEQMRRGVIALGVATTIARNRRPRFSKLHSARYFSERGNPSVDFADFVDVDAPSLALDLTAVGDLAARFGIEWRLAQDHGGATVRQILLGENGGGDVERVVARERVDPVVSVGNLTRPLNRRRADAKRAFPRNPFPAGERIP